MHDDVPVTSRRFSSQLFAAGLLIEIIHWVNASVCLATPFSTGEQLVTIGQSFTVSRFANSGFILPDTMGAVGPTSFVELLNGRYSVYEPRAQAH